MTDSCGRADGIGSRFFTVQNSSSVMTTTDESLPQGRHYGRAGDGIDVSRGPEGLHYDSRSIRVRVVVGPTMRVAIDTPRNGVTADQPLVIAGWAIDLAAPDESGVDTLHGWAYPVGGGDPIFLGVATYGGGRPDVAATYGAQFEHAGYTVVASGLPSGTYDIVVYAHRASTGLFNGAQTVRVMVR